MKSIIFLPIILLSLYCSAQTKLEKYLFDNDRIIVEKSDSAKHYDDVYSSDNTIYTFGRKFTYSYYYQNKKEENFLIKRGEQVHQPEGFRIHDWDFIEVEKQDDETVTKIILKPKPGNPFEKEVPDYNQTAIGYEYQMNNGESFTKEVTGAIENEMNVWIHPPRNLLLQILELNPFPYIKAPYKVGTKWNWKLNIGDFWSDKRWLVWKGSIENIYEYEIKEQKTISTKLGNLECFIIHATAKSRIGETELISYFNTKFGFVKLEYKNIDGTKTILELERVDE